MSEIQLHYEISPKDSSIKLTMDGEEVFLPISLVPTYHKLLLDPSKPNEMVENPIDIEEHNERAKVFLTGDRIKEYFDSIGLGDQSAQESLTHTAPERVLNPQGTIAHESLAGNIDSDATEASSAQERVIDPNNDAITLDPETAEVSMDQYKRVSPLTYILYLAGIVKTSARPEKNQFLVPTDEDEIAALSSDIERPKTTKIPSINQLKTLLLKQIIETLEHATTSEEQFIRLLYYIPFSTIIALIKISNNTPDKIPVAGVDIFDIPVALLSGSVLGFALYYLLNVKAPQTANRAKRDFMDSIPRRYEVLDE